MKHLKKVTVLVLTALLTLTCFVSYQQVSAENPNAGEHFYVEGDGNGWSYQEMTLEISSGQYYDSASAYVIRILADGDYTISKACNCSDGTVHEGYSIVIDSNVTVVNLTLDNVHMQTSAITYLSSPTSGQSAGYDTLQINGSSNVTLTLEGNNSLLASTWGFYGIGAGSATSLTIISNSNGYLTVQGGEERAGIRASSLTISDANVIVIGGDGSEEAISGVSNITLSYTDGYCTSTSAAGNLVYTSSSGNENVSGNYFLGYGKDACELLANERGITISNTSAR